MHKNKGGGAEPPTAIPMKLRQLGYFISVVDAGSFSRASERIRVAQPALSQQIANLEAELGVRLLIRSPQGVRPTVAGQAVYRRGLAVQREIDGIRACARAGEGVTGKVSVALPSSFAADFATPILAAVQQKYPEICVQIVDCPSHLCQRKLLRGAVNIAVICQPLHPGLEQRRLFRYPAFLVEAPPSQPGRSSPIRCADLARQKLILPARPNIMRETIEQCFVAAGVQALPVAEVDSLSVLLSLIDAGAGGGVLGWISAIAGRYRWRRIVEPTPTLDVFLCSAAATPPTEAVSAIFDLVEQAIMRRVRQPDWMGAIAEPAAAEYVM